MVDGCFPGPQHHHREIALIYPEMVATKLQSKNKTCHNSVCSGNSPFMWVMNLEIYFQAKPFNLDFLPSEIPNTFYLFKHFTFCWGCWTPVWRGKIVRSKDSKTFLYCLEVLRRSDQLNPDFLLAEKVCLRARTSFPLTPKSPKTLKSLSLLSAL